MCCTVACACDGGQRSEQGPSEEATWEAAKHGDQSEPLAALVAQARMMLEQGRAEHAERARAEGDTHHTGHGGHSLHGCVVGQVPQQRLWWYELRWWDARRLH
jgi:hypothetical protein